MDHVQERLNPIDLTRNRALLPISIWAIIEASVPFYSAALSPQNDVCEDFWYDQRDALRSCRNGVCCARCGDEIEDLFAQYGSLCRSCESDVEDHYMTPDAHARNSSTSPLDPLVEGPVPDYDSMFSRYS